MAPQLVSWHERYAEKGLVVLTVEHGLATPLEELRAYVEGAPIRHPVLHDGAGATIQGYGVSGFPFSIVVGRDGKVLWEGFPVGREEEIERTFLEALGG